MKYKGLELEQDVNTLDVFRDFLSKEKFDVIIELGTKYGGLTQFLTELHNNIHTFDIGNYMNSAQIDYLLASGTMIYIEDIFETNTVSNLMQNNKRILLLCDNGNKIREVQRFTPYLKKHDVILAHDYFPTENDVYHVVGPPAYGDKPKTVRRWSSHEISDKDVDYDVLEPFFAKEFEAVFWLCCRRK